MPGVIPPFDVVCTSSPTIKVNKQAEGNRYFTHEKNCEIKECLWKVVVAYTCRYNP